MTKEEKKDEMKNRISMALKDPILQQGFEIICKNVVDLETENNKLLDVINNQDVKIADLEQKLEKKKCCANCKHFNYKEVGTGNKDCILWQVHKIFCKNKDKWELRR